MDHPRPELLPEIIDMVLSFLNPETDQDQAGRRSFQNYLLISKDWLHFGRKYYFGRITLRIRWHGQELTDFNHFLAECPHISDYIRSLTLSPYIREGRVSVQQLAALLGLLTRLDSLTISYLGITSDLSTTSQKVLAAFHLIELHLEHLTVQSSSLFSSPFHDLFNLFSSIQSLTVSSCGFGHWKWVATNKLVVSRIKFTGGMGNEPEDKPLTILLRDVVDSSSVKTIRASLGSPPDLVYSSQLVDKTFKSPNNPLNIELVFSTASLESYWKPAEIQHINAHLPLTQALTSATLILVMRSRDITDAQFLHSLSTLILAKPPPNIQFLRLEMRIEARYVPFFNKVDVLKQLGWSTFGRSVKEWATLEHLEIVIRVGIHGQDETECGIAEVRDSIVRGLGVVKNIVKSITIV